MKIKNKHYRQFLDRGIIDIITEEQLIQVLETIEHRNPKQARAVLIALYFLGARPIEILHIQGKDFKKIGNQISVFVQTSKRGKARTIHLPYKNKFIKELYEYSRSWFPEAYIFFEFRGKYTRIIKKKDGTLKERIEMDHKLRYYIKKWFKDIMEESITPYYLRHNRFSKLAIKGMSMENIRMIKGGRSMASVDAYIHMSTAQAKRLAKFFND